MLVTQISPSCRQDKSNTICVSSFDDGFPEEWIPKNISWSCMCNCRVHKPLGKELTASTRMDYDYRSKPGTNKKEEELDKTAAKLEGEIQMYDEKLRSIKRNAQLLSMNSSLQSKGHVHDERIATAPTPPIPRLSIVSKPHNYQENDCIVKSVINATGQGCQEIIGRRRGSKKMIWKTHRHKTAKTESSCMLQLKESRYKDVTIKMTFSDANAVPLSICFEHSPKPTMAFKLLGRISLHARSMKQLKHVFRLGKDIQVERCLRISCLGNVGSKSSGIHSVSYLEVTGEFVPEAAVEENGYPLSPESSTSSGGTVCHSIGQSSDDLEIENEHRYQDAKLSSNNTTLQMKNNESKDKKMLEIDECEDFDRASSCGKHDGEYGQTVVDKNEEKGTSSAVSMESDVNDEKNNSLSPNLRLFWNNRKENETANAEQMSREEHVKNSNSHDYTVLSKEKHLRIINVLNSLGLKPDTAKLTLLQLLGDEEGGPEACDQDYDCLFECVPTREEVEICAQKLKARITLDQAENFVLAVSEIPALHSRSKAYLFLRSFSERVEKIVSSAEIMASACEEIIRSKFLKSAISIANMIGGFLPSSKFRSDCTTEEVFKVEFLNELAEIKATESQSKSLLHFLARELSRKHSDVHIFEEFPSIKDAASISSSMLRYQMNELVEGIEFVYRVSRDTGADIDHMNETLDLAIEQLADANSWIMKADAAFLDVQSFLSGNADKLDDSSLFLSALLQFFIQLQAAQRENSVADSKETHALRDINGATSTKDTIKNKVSETEIKSNSVSITENGKQTGLKDGGQAQSSENEKSHLRNSLLASIRAYNTVGVLQREEMLKHASLSDLKVPIKSVNYGSRSVPELKLKGSKSSGDWKRLRSSMDVKHDIQDSENPLKLESNEEKYHDSNNDKFLNESFKVKNISQLHIADEYQEDEFVRQASPVDAHMCRNLQRELASLDKEMEARDENIMKGRVEAQEFDCPSKKLVDKGDINVSSPVAKLVASSLDLIKSIDLQNENGLPSRFASVSLYNNKQDNLITTGKENFPTTLNENEATSESDTMCDDGYASACSSPSLKANQNGDELALTPQMKWKQKGESNHKADMISSKMSLKHANTRVWKSQLAELCNEESDTEDAGEAKKPNCNNQNSVLTSKEMNALLSKMPRSDTAKNSYNQQIDDNQFLRRSHPVPIIKMGKASEHDSASLSKSADWEYLGQRNRRVIQNVPKGSKRVSFSLPSSPSKHVLNNNVTSSKQVDHKESLDLHLAAQLMKNVLNTQRKIPVNHSLHESEGQDPDDELIMNKQNDILEQLHKSEAVRDSHENAEKSEHLELDTHVSESAVQDQDGPDPKTQSIAADILRKALAESLRSSLPKLANYGSPELPGLPLANSPINLDVFMAAVLAHAGNTPTGPLARGVRGGDRHIFDDVAAEKLREQASKRSKDSKCDPLSRSHKALLEPIVPAPLGMGVRISETVAGGISPATLREGLKTHLRAESTSTLLLPPSSPKSVNNVGKDDNGGNSACIIEELGSDSFERTSSEGVINNETKLNSSVNAPGQEEGKLDKGDHMQNTVEQHKNEDETNVSSELEVDYDGLDAHALQESLSRHRLQNWNGKKICIDPGEYDPRCSYGPY